MDARQERLIREDMRARLAAHAMEAEGLDAEAAAHRYGFWHAEMMKDAIARMKARDEDMKRGK